MQGKKIIFFLISRWPIHNSNPLTPFLVKLREISLSFCLEDENHLIVFQGINMQVTFIENPQFQNGQFSGRKTEIEGHLKAL